MLLIKQTGLLLFEAALAVAVVKLNCSESNQSEHIRKQVNKVQANANTKDRNECPSAVKILDFKILNEVGEGQQKG